MQQAAIKVAQAWEDALQDREVLSLAYARLFLGPFEILASPYASFYLEPDQRPMGEISQQVVHTYAEASLGPEQAPREIPDHIALEWEFMYYLTYQHMTTGDQRWLEKRKLFYNAHMKHWVPALAKAISQSKQHAFYLALAELLTAVFETSAPE